MKMVYLQIASFVTKVMMKYIAYNPRIFFNKILNYIFLFEYLLLLIYEKYENLIN